MQNKLLIAMAMFLAAPFAFADATRKPNSVMPPGKWQCSDQWGNHSVRISGEKVSSPAGAQIISAKGNGDATWDVKVQFKDGSSFVVTCSEPGVD